MPSNRVDNKDYYSTGVEKFNAGEYTLAMEYFQAAIASQPSNESAYLKLSESFLSLGKNKEATSTLYKLLSINPSCKSAHELLKKTDERSTPKAGDVPRKGKKVEEQDEDDVDLDEALDKLDDILLRNQELLNDIQQTFGIDIDDNTNANKLQVQSIKTQANPIKGGDFYLAVARQKEIQKKNKQARIAIFFLRLNIILLKKNKRKIKVLESIIARREKEISKVKIADYYPGGDALPQDIIKGRVTIYSIDQESQPFTPAPFCKRDVFVFQKHIDCPKTLSIRKNNWQILFFHSVMLVENNKGFAVIPYSSLSVSSKEVLNGRLTDSHGHEVYYQTWYHARVDGGPDRRFNSNWPLYSICRYQVKLQVKNTSDSAVYLMFDKEDDANNLIKIIRYFPKRKNASLANISSKVADSTEIAKWFKYIANNS